MMLLPIKPGQIKGGVGEWDNSQDIRGQMYKKDQKMRKNQLA